MFRTVVFINFLAIIFGKESFWSHLNISPDHIPFYFHNNLHLRRICQEDPTCPYKNVKEGMCWGYEDDCDWPHRYSQPACPHSSRYWTHTKEEQLSQFWKSADFGYVRDKRQEMTTICESRYDDRGSSLECVGHSRLCRVKRLFIDLRRARLHERTSRYDEDILKSGDMGGNCYLNSTLLKQMGEHKSPLQSWYAEIEHFTELNFTYDDSCDVILDKPTFFIKLDAVVNLYHHFCDFVNLYLSQHFNNSFSTDVYVLVWDTSVMKPQDFFRITWSAFTHHPVLFLPQFNGKRLCVRHGIFSFLPRMRYGLYYNMPLIPGCHGSGFIKAFNEHILYRLGVSRRPITNKIRITLLSRESIYRNILNENELLTALNKVSTYEVVRRVYSFSMPFITQIKSTHSTDIFIGIHGAGLTHALFLPDWGVLFEIYNCDDVDCYQDLARLRGIKYITWNQPMKVYPEDQGHHPTLGAHAKFTNYRFDVNVFMELVSDAAAYVKAHPKYRMFISSDIQQCKSINQLKSQLKRLFTEVCN